MVKPKQLRIAGSCILCFAVLFAVCLYSFNTFIAPLESETRLLFLIIVLSNVLQATLLFIWADVLGRHNFTIPRQPNEIEMTKGEPPPIKADSIRQPAHTD
jgi:hypothetical protein